MAKTTPGARMTIAAAVILALVGCSNLPASPPAGRQVSQLFQKWAQPDSPGCSVGISRDGQLVYERGFGMANLELRVPIAPTSVFEAASISKQFTAMSIMLLVQRGRISLDDAVQKYLPEFPAYDRPLTIRHLLNHTSGLRDAFLLFEISAPEDPYADRNDIIVKQLARQRSLNYQPGTESQYNNGGYILLAEIVERVSGEPLAAFADANIFKPLGMTGTRFQDDPAVLIPDRASNYSRAGGTWRLVPFGTQPGAVGNSGLWTTTRDLLKWANNLADAKVGSKALLAEMQNPTPIVGPEGARWGLGFEISEHRGATFVGHSGGDRGIDNYFAWYPQQRLAIAVLCNHDSSGSRQLTQQIAELYLPALPSPASVATPAPSRPAIERMTLTSAQLRAYTGVYASSELDAEWTIAERGSALVIRRLGKGDTVVEPIATDVFTTIGDYMRFSRDTRGAITGFTLVSSGARGLRFERVQSAQPLKQ